MFKRTIALALFLTVSSAPAAAEEAACDGSCEGEKVMVSYADGNTVTCMCVEPSAMEPTVEDPTVPTGVDENNTY